LKPIFYDVAGESKAGLAEGGEAGPQKFRSAKLSVADSLCS